MNSKVSISMVCLQSGNKISFVTKSVFGLYFVNSSFEATQINQPILIHTM